jgi:hypothetical protein
LVYESDNDKVHTHIDVWASCLHCVCAFKQILKHLFILPL